MFPLCSYLDLPLFRVAVQPEQLEPQLLPVDVRRPDRLGEGCVARHACGDVLPGRLGASPRGRPGDSCQGDGVFM